MAMQFLVRGAIDAGEPACSIAFEESPAELARTGLARMGSERSAGRGVAGDRSHSHQRE